jgi:DNA-binding Xre family transcriptional regulator
MKGKKNKDEVEDFVDNELQIALLERYYNDELDYNDYPELPFSLDENGRITFNYGFNYSDALVEDSKMLFETGLMKPYISKFVTGANKNITMANVYKLCVLLNCSPNDLFNWETWRNKLGELASEDNFTPITTEQIKKLL